MTATYTTSSEVLAIRDALRVLRDWLPEPRNEPGHAERDRAIVYARRKHNEALDALRELEENLRVLVEDAASSSAGSGETP